MANQYELWIKQGDKAIWLPVNPPTITLSIGSKNETIDIDGLGDSTILRSPALLEFSFSSEFPARYYMGCNYKDLPDPFEAFNLINGMKKDHQVRFVATNTPFNLQCTIEEFNITEDGGEVGTLKYSITLLEYRKATARRVEVENGKAKINKTEPQKRTDNRVKSKTYTVKSGDFLIKIAKKELGDSSKWKDIYILNKKVIGSNPNALKVGQVLKMP